MSLSLRLRALPGPVQWAGAGALIFGDFAVRHMVFGSTPVFPFALSYVTVSACGFLFRQSAGMFAIAVSALLSVYLYVDPTFTHFIGRWSDVVALGLFLSISTITVRLLDALHAARAAAEAGERERRMLMIEYGHRVKNDLAGVAGMLQLQASGAPPEAADALRTAADRVLVVARMHDRLSHAAGAINVDMRDYLQGIISDLTSVAAEGRPIQLRLTADDIALPIARASAVGLITNELVTNALKHAFPNGRPGRVDVGLHRAGKEVVLTVYDDGAGSIDTQQSRGLGQRLTRALASQLGGRIETKSANSAGTRHILRFEADRRSRH